jgi:uncharacterized membrane protein
MKYTVQIDIDLPRHQVIELIKNADNLPKWQKGLLSSEGISGVPGQLGAKSRLVFKFGQGNMEMIETITKINLPDEFDGTYEAPGVFNTVKNRFIAVRENRTRWESENEFRFTTLSMKAMGFLMKSSFPKQSMAFLRDFKNFAENGTDVRTTS